MQKEKLVSSLFVVLFSLVEFAQHKKEEFLPADQARAASQSYDQFPIIILVFISIFSLAVIVWAGYLFWKRFDGLDAVLGKTKDPSKSKGNIYDILNTINTRLNSPLGINGRNGSQTACLSQESEQWIRSAIQQSLSSSDLAETLQTCSEKTGGIQTSLDSFLEKAQQIAEMNAQIEKMNGQMEKLISEQPELVNLSIGNSVELLKECQKVHFNSPEVIKNITPIINQYWDLGFSSIEELAECKTYYDARNQHADEKVKLNRTITQQETTINQLTADKESLSQANARLKAESERLSGENENLSKVKVKLTTDLKTAEDERNRLSRAMKSLCPDEVQADSLFKLLETTSPELRAETVALVVQLYWFAQLSRNTPNKTKAAFTKFDETLYELFADKQELLQDIRKTILNFVNKVVFQATSYEVLWPLLDSSASEHEDRYNRENDEGNRISKVRSAVIFNAGKVESVARIYTSL